MSDAIQDWCRLPFIGLRRWGKTNALVAYLMGRAIYNAARIAIGVRL